MNFTEEEFYGNNQGTVLEDGEVVNIQNEEKGQGVQINVAKTVGLTFVKTIIGMLGFAFYFVCTMVCLAPKQMIKVFDFASLDNASLFCYERVYKQEQTLANLYNLVQKSIENKNYKKTNKYINELQGKSDYVNFCLKVNAASLKDKSKKYVAFYGDFDGYLVSQNVLALYGKNQKEEAMSVAESDLINPNIYSFGLNAFVGEVESDKSLNENEKKAIKAAFIDKELTLNGQTKKLFEFISDRLNSLEINDDLTIEDKILRTYSSLKINRFMLKVYEANEKTVEAEQVRLTIKSLNQTYADLIK